MGEMARLNVADEKFSKTKALGFSLLRVGNILNGLMVGEVTYFATNSLGVTAAAVSAGVALKTAIDAVTDLPMGAVIDKTHTRFGKARPYVLAGILMWLCTIAIFVAPSGWFAGMSQQGKNTALVVYITLFSTLASAVFGTMCNIGYETHIKRCVVYDKNRIKLLTIVGVVFAVGSLVLQMALPAVIASFHGAQQGFVIIALVTGALGIASCIAAFFMCKEYSEEELAAYGGYDSSQAKENVPIGVFLKSIFKNKYVFMYTIINFCFMLIMMSTFTIGQYYFQYVYGNLGTFSIVMAMSALMLPIYIFIPKICNKFGVASVIRGSMILAAEGVVVRMFFPRVLPLQCIGYLLLSLPNIFIACVGSQINFECMEYGRYKTGVIAEGMYSAFISFAQKMATSLSSVLIGVILSMTGFDLLTAAVFDNGFANWEELAALGVEGFDQYVSGGAQAVEGALSGISFAYNVIPLIFLAIDIVLLCFFDLEKQLKKLRVENGLNEDGSRRN